MNATAGPRSHAPELLCVGSFGLSAVLAAGLGADDARFFALAGACALAALASAFVARRRAGPALAAAVLNLCLLVPELGLRGAEFHYISGLQFGYPAAQQFREFKLDPELFWTLRQDASGAVNSLGFYGPEPVQPKPAGTFRFLVLGDSCAQQGHPQAWPELAAAALAAHSAQPVDVVNLSMSGYSSHQGLVLARRNAAALEPDLVVIGYGWNDHWLARGAVDAQKRIDVRAERLYRASRLLQFLRRLYDAWGSDETAAPLERARVPLDSYRENLRAMVALFRERGARVVLLTAPTTHDLFVPSYLLVHSFARSAQDVVDLHRRYNEVVRDVQRESDAELLDLEREFAARPERTQLFLEDGIHFNAVGRALVAERFVARVRELAPGR